MQNEVKIERSVSEDGKPLIRFTCGDWFTTLNRGVKNPELVQEILQKCQALSAYERDMIGQWLLELY